MTASHTPPTSTPAATARAAAAAEQVCCGIDVAQRQAAARVELHALVACRRQLLHVRTEQSNRRGTTTSKAALNSIDAALAALDKQVASLDKQIRAVVDADMREADRTLSAVEGLLRSVPGVGHHLSALRLAGLQELGNTDRRRTASLAGVAPTLSGVDGEDQSGDRVGKKSIRGGRAAVRNGLSMAALTAARCNPVIRPFYQRLRAKGYSAEYALRPPAWASSWACSTPCSATD